MHRNSFYFITAALAAAVLTVSGEVQSETCGSSPEACNEASAPKSHALLQRNVVKKYNLTSVEVGPDKKERQKDHHKEPEKKTLIAEEVKRHTETKPSGGKNTEGLSKSAGQQMNFRPVSTTVYCVMALTIQGLLIYTGLALARNADELSGKNTVSVVTEVLSLASRSSVYGVMLSLFFLACRMYVLATTKGRGEPPIWAKHCMVTATVGMTLQIILVVMLPLLAKTGGKRESGQSLAELVGTPSDAHPRVSTLDYHHKYLKWFALFVQVATMACIYGGAGGVVYCILTFPAQTTQISAAVSCTCILGVVYFGAFFLLWLTRLIADFTSRATKAAILRNSGTLQMSESASLSMSAVVSKAPMFALIFLTARERALQLNPPNGMPSHFEQNCFKAITGTLILEAFFAGLVGLTGKQTEGYYGMPTWTATPALHILQHSCAAVTYGALAPVVHSTIAMGGDAPLAPTSVCILILGGLFFATHLAKLAASVAHEVFWVKLPMLEDTVMAASISTNFIPLFGSLFMAARMRALQITQQQGGPQVYAQECMYACVFATVIQVTCCILMPIFTNAATTVDADGNSSYDAKPLVGAYAVSIIKYVALLGLHGGIFCTCYSVLTISPYNANYEQYQLDWRKVQKLGASTIFIVLLSLVLSSAKVIGLVIKWSIEAIPEDVLGTTLRCGKSSLGLCEGYVNVHGFYVDNPTLAGSQWNTDHLLKVDRLCVKINIWRLIRTLGAEFELTAIILEGAEVIFEKNFNATSNVGQILDHLGVLDEDEEEAPAEPAEEPPTDDEGKKKPEEQNPQGTGSAAPAAPAEQVVESAGEVKAEEAAAEEEEEDIDVFVHHVSVRDIHACAVIQGKNFSLAVGDIVFEDLQKELDDNGAPVGKIVAIILDTILKTVMKNAISMQNNVSLKDIKQMGTQAVADMMGNDLIQSPC